MVNAVGKDLRRLSVEVDKAVAFTGAKVELTAEDIEQVVSTAATTSVFELGTALGDRDCARALRLLDRLLGDGESVYGLHALALRQVRDLIAARALIDRGGGSVGRAGRRRSAGRTGRFATSRVRRGASRPTSSSTSCVRLQQGRHK